jgi:hypothetical protein
MTSSSSTHSLRASAKPYAMIMGNCFFFDGGAHTTLHHVAPCWSPMHQRRVQQGWTASACAVCLSSADGTPSGACHHLQITRGLCCTWCHQASCFTEPFASLPPPPLQLRSKLRPRNKLASGLSPHAALQRHFFLSPAPVHHVPGHPRAQAAANPPSLHPQSQPHTCPLSMCVPSRDPKQRFSAAHPPRRRRSEMSDGNEEAHQACSIASTVAHLTAQPLWLLPACMH